MTFNVLHHSIIVIGRASNLLFWGISPWNHIRVSRSRQPVLHIFLCSIMIIVHEPGVHVCGWPKKLTSICSQSVTMEMSQWRPYCNYEDWELINSLQCSIPILFWKIKYSFKTIYIFFDLSVLWFQVHWNEQTFSLPVVYLTLMEDLNAVHHAMSISARRQGGEKVSEGNNESIDQRDDPHSNILDTKITTMLH